jgi:hypothetical protein
MSNDRYSFQPIQCSHDVFQNLSPQDGCLYFVTDKKKIYLGKQGKKVPMSATYSFFYGIKEI